MNGYLSSEELGVGTNISLTERSSRTPRWHCERWFRISRSMHRARFICVTDDSCNSNGCHGKATRMRRTSSGRSISQHPGQKWKVHRRYWKFLKSECPDIWIRQPRHKWPKIMVQHGRPSRSSWAKSVRSSFGRTALGKAIRERSIGTRLGKSSKVVMFICKPRKIAILICVCGRHQIGWKETKHWPNVESTHETNRFGRTNIILSPRQLGVYSKTWSAKQAQILSTITEVCLNPGSPQEQLKNYHARKNLSISSCSCDMEGHAKKCVERYCELANKTTQQLYKVSTPCIDDHHFKEEELISVGELSQVCSQIVLQSQLGFLGCFPTTHKTQHLVCGDSCIRSNGQEGSTEVIKAVYGRSMGARLECSSKFRNQRDRGKSCSTSKKKGTASAMVQTVPPDQWSVRRNVNASSATCKMAYEEPAGTPTFRSRGKGASVWQKGASRPIMGYVFRAGDGWSGDVLIADCEHLQNLSAYGIHVKRSKHQEVAQEGKLLFSTCRWISHALQSSSTPTRRNVRHGFWRTQLRRSGWCHSWDSKGLEACSFVTLGTS